MANNLAPSITLIFQASLRQGTVPDFDKFASVTYIMIKYLGWPTLEQRSNELRVLVLFKIVNQQVDKFRNVISECNNVRFKSKRALILYIAHEDFNNLLPRDML